MKHVQYFKWIITLIFCFVLVGSASAESIEFTLKAEQYQIILDKEGYDVIKMEKFATKALPGSSVLPHKIFHIAVPPDIDWESLKLDVSSVNKENLPGAYKIRTCPHDIAWDGSQWLSSSDKPEGPQGEGPVRIVATSQLRKWKFVKVEFMPFQYNSETGELQLIKKANITLSYMRTYEITNPAELQDSVLDDVAKNLFLNYSQAAEWYASDNSREAPSAISDYVIITTEAIKTNSTKLDDFIAHKEIMGFTVSVITETTWGAMTGQAPNHKAEKIREWLKSNYISMGIEYVLLIGNPSPYESGEGDVPMKMCWPRFGAGDGDEDSPTDYFFADLTGNWDKDGDGYYGEWSQDMGVGGVDFTPEVYVGRIPVYSGAYLTLDSILQKTIDYEQSYGDTAWRKSILLPMGFQAAGYDGAQLSEQMKDDFLISEGYTYWRQYQQGTAYATDNSIYTSEQELRGDYVVRDRWSANDYGIVCWWGHGSSVHTEVGYSPNWDGDLFRNTYCSFLDDAHPAFTYQCSCTNAYPEVSSNLAYSILKQGGIATVSATRVSWFNTGVGYGAFDGSTTNSGIGYEYVKRLIVDEYAAADALFLAKVSMTPGSNTRLMNYYDFNIYGDPATSLLYVVSVPPSITVTSPNGGETLVPSSVHNITWTAFGGISNVKIQYSTNAGENWTTIVASTSAAAGSYPWTVPSTQSTQCLIKISDASDGYPYDYSNSVFTISGGTATIPTVETSLVDYIGGAIAISGGNVTADGGTGVTARGVCWSTSPNPTISSPHTDDGTGVGSFISNMTGLLPNTEYYVRAYATNSAGTGYGNPYNFWTTTVSDLPFSEDFTDSSWPAGWSQQNQGVGMTNRWLLSNSGYAGGTPYEMRCGWTGVYPGTSRLVTPPINTTGHFVLNLEFKHFLDTYMFGGLILKIQTSNDGISWTDEVWSVLTSDSDIGPETISTILTHNLNSPATYVAFVITGDFWYFDYWFIDDVSINRGFFEFSGSWTGAGHGADGWYVGDFNGDGKEDIFRYVPGTSGAEVFLSDGTKFIHSGSWTGAGHGTDGWYVGDFNGDGMDDIFRYVAGVSGAQVFLSDGVKFNYDSSWTGAGHGTDGWYVGDFNDDGMADIFRYVPGTSGAQVFLSNGAQFKYAGSWTGAGHGTDGWYVGDFNGDGKKDIFRYVPGTSGADVFLSDGTKFVYSGSWTGAGHGADGWYIGDFNGDGKKDIFRYIPGTSGAQVFLANTTSLSSSTSTFSLASIEQALSFDEDMMLDVHGSRQSELSFQEETALLTPFMTRMMMGEEVSIYEIKTAYEERASRVVRMVEIRQMLYRHGYWDIEGQFGRVKEQKEKKDHIR
jgi:hypothetical protein